MKQVQPIAGDEFGPFDHPFKALRACAPSHSVPWQDVVLAAHGEPYDPLVGRPDFYTLPHVIRRVAESLNLVAYRTSSGHWMAIWTCVPELRNILLGDAVVLSTRHFDVLAPYFHSGIASMANPRQVGTLDAWVVGTLEALRSAHPIEFARTRARAGLSAEIPAPNWGRVKQLEFVATPRPFDVVAGMGLFVNGCRSLDVILDERLTQQHCSAVAQATNDQFDALLRYTERELGPMTKSRYEALVQTFVENHVKKTGTLSTQSISSELASTVER